MNTATTEQKTVTAPKTAQASSPAPKSEGKKGRKPRGNCESSEGVWFYEGTADSGSFVPGKRLTNEKEAKTASVRTGKMYFKIVGVMAELKSVGEDLLVVTSQVPLK
jgi:hypothetical protein